MGFTAHCDIKKPFRGMVITLASALALSLSACSLDSPTTLAQKRVEVIEQTQRVKIETESIDQDVIDNIAYHYDRYGDGPVEIMVTYSPSSPGNTALNATNNAARIAKGLRAFQIEQVDTTIMPVHDSPSLTLINYTSYKAQKPEGCTNAEDIDDTVFENHRDYQLGCSIESYIALQTARPKDLLGRGEIRAVDDGRKRGLIVESHKWRTRNAPLEAERPSE